MLVSKPCAVVTALVYGILHMKFSSSLWSLIKAYVLFLLQGPASLPPYTCVTTPAARCDLVMTEYLPDSAGAAGFC